MPATTHATTHRSDTRSVRIDAPPDHVFDFVSDPENLPRWAVGFCRAIRRDPTATDRWIVTTAQDDVPVRYVAERSLGVVDFVLSPAPGTEVTAFSRVLPSGTGAEYVFTQLQPAGMPDDAFDAQVHALIEELQLLRAHLHARAACPA
jgi:polyketide cyclase/dehydrase/lipid transport protein